MTQVDLSVVIPVFNQGTYLEEALRSVTGNTHLPREIVIVDDGSTDGSLETASRSASDVVRRFPMTVKLVIQSNKGLSAARNAGIEVSRGEYVICLDADDLLSPDYIEATCDTMQFAKADIVYTDFHCFGAGDAKYNPPDFDEEILRKDNFIHCAALLRRQVAITLNGYDEGMREGWEDYDFWLRAARAKFRFVKCWHAHLLWRRKSGSMIEAVNPERLRRYLKDKHGGYFLG